MVTEAELIGVDVDSAVSAGCDGFWHRDCCVVGGCLVQGVVPAVVWFGADVEALVSWVMYEAWFVVVAAIVADTGSQCVRCLHVHVNVCCFWSVLCVFFLGRVVLLRGCDG